MSTEPAAKPLATPAFRAGLEACIHCGLCLSACPTYDLLGAEPDGPRGRIALLGAATRGEIALHGGGEEVPMGPAAQHALRTHLDRCLGCRACESACPSGVPYGYLLEEGRAALVTAESESSSAGGSIGKPWFRPFLLGLLARRRTLRVLALVAALAHRTGLLALARSLPLPAPWIAALRLTPPPALRAGRPSDRGVLPATGPGPHRGAVALFRGCVQDAGLGAVNGATVALLRARGYDVHLVPEQTCCGALARHAGEPGIADTLARRNRAAFGAPGVATLPIVVNAGGCAATLAEDGQGEGRQGAAAASKQASARGEDEAARALFPGIGHRIVDLSAFLAASDSNDPVAQEHLDRARAPRSTATPDAPRRPRVAYLDSCHLRHGLGIRDEPRALIAAQTGFEAVELPNPDRCCGSAGTYNLLQRELSDAVLARRLDDLRAARPDILVVANPGCHLQLLAGVREAGLPIEVLHMAQWLARVEGLAVAGSPRGAAAS